MNQQIAGFDIKSLLVSRLMPAFAEPAFSNFSMYDWKEGTDLGSAVVVQRYQHSEALVMTFGSTASGEIFVEYWVRNGTANMTQPTQEEKLKATPVRLGFEVYYLQSAANYIIEVINSFHETTFPNNKVVPLRRPA